MPPHLLPDANPPPKPKQSYYLVPSLKAIITHKISSWIYEDNVVLDLCVLNADILEYMTNKMPFCVIYRIYEQKLAGEAIGLEFLKNYSDSKQFQDETRSMLQKQLKIKHETKIGHWTTFRRACLRNPDNISLFWKDFTKSEREIVKRSSRLSLEKTMNGVDGNNEGFTAGVRQMATEWGASKSLSDWKEKSKAPGSSRTLMFQEYYDLIVKTAEKYSIHHIPLFLVKKVDEEGVNQKVLRDLETEIKCFILRMKMLTNDFLPLQRQCTTYAPLPIWIKPSPVNKDHKYKRSRTKLILQQRQLSFQALVSASAPPSSTPSSSPPPSSPLPSASISSSQSSVCSSTPPDTHIPIVTADVSMFDSVFASVAATVSRVQRVEEAVMGIRAREEHAINAMQSLRELKRTAHPCDSDEETEDEKGENYYINNFNTQADSRVRHSKRN